MLLSGSPLQTEPPQGGRGSEYSGTGGQAAWQVGRGQRGLSEQRPPLSSCGVISRQGGAGGCHLAWPSFADKTTILKRLFNLQDGFCQQHGHIHLKMAEPNFFF